MKNIKKHYKILIGFLLIILGIGLILSKVIYIYYLDYLNNNGLERFFNSKKAFDENNTSIFDGYNYIAVLEIPSIELKRGLVSVDSSYNSVKYNIEIIEQSKMPDVEKGNLILASHNGTSQVAFFKNLDKLEIGDKVYVYYENYKYEYLVDDIYDTLKDGNIEIYRDNDKTTITLITCKKNTKDTQTVYIGYLENKELY